MSLKVWLPLNGNLENQGISNLSFQTTGTINIDTGGKIGQTYTANSAGTIVSNQMINLGTNVSMFGWAKISTFNNSPIGIFGQHRFTNFTGMGLNFVRNTDTTGRLSVNTGDGSNRTWNSYVGTTILNTNTWYHVGFTYDGSKIRIYINGAVDKEYAYTSQLNVSDYIYMYGWSLTGTSGNDIYASYKLSGSLNDVRIYDECLSQKEIKEIAKGLVCHYKLIGERPNRNYILNSAFSGKTAAGLYTFNKDVVTFETDAFNQSGSSFALSINPSAIENFKDKNLTFSMEYKIDTALTFGTTNPWVGFEFVVTRNATTGGSTQWLSWYGGKNIPTAVTDGWIKYSKTVFVQSEDIASVGINFYFRDTTGKISFRHPKIEIGTKATEWRSTDSDYEYDILDSHENVTTDCSGYKNNLIQAESITFNPDSPKYNGSTQMGGTNANRFYTQNILLGDNSTICCWICPKDLTSTTQWVYHLGNGSGTASDIQHGMYINSSAIVWDVGVQGSYSYALQNNQWYFIATTTDGTISKLYLNGTEVKTLTPTYIQKTVLTLCNRSGNSDGTSSGGYPFKGSISDVRVYATALSAEEILTLYKNSGIIDNNNDVYTREFDEPQIQSSLNQMPTNVNRSGAALTATLEDEPTSITGKATKFLCTTAGSGWYWSGWGKNDLVNGEQYVLTMYVKSPNRTAFRMNIEASSAGHKNYTIGTEYTKIEYPFTYNSTTSYSALTCYQSPAMAIDDEIWIHSICIYKANEYNKSKINKTGIINMNGFDERSIPGGYTQLEYIESTGTQYINTGVIGGTNLNVEIKAKVINSSSQYIFGTNPASKRYMITQQSDGNLLNCDLYSSSYRVRSTIVGYTTDAHVFKINYKSFYIDGNLIGTATCQDFISDYTTYLFGCNNNGTATLSAIKIYYCKIWDNNKLIRYFIPVLHNSDNMAGLYDLVNGIFYTNAGTGDFKYILDEIPSEYTQVKYIESNGTQWIDSGVNSKPTLKIFADFQFTNISTTQQRVFGRTCDNGSSTALDFDFYINGSNYWAWGCQNGNGNWQSTNKTKDMDRHTLIFNSYENKISLDENFYSTTISTTRTNIDSANIYIFGSNLNSSGAARFSYIKLYSFKIWDEGELIRDFIPVQRKSDSKLGLYDIINNIFYINQSSGDDFSYSVINNWPYINYSKFNSIASIDMNAFDVKIYKNTNKIIANEFWEI